MKLSDVFGKRHIDPNKPEDPLVFYGAEDEKAKKKAQEAIYFVNKEINSETNFAITKDTEQGKYVVSGLLTFHFNGVKIITEKNNIIFVDVNNKSVFIKDNSKSSNTIAPTNPEERHYVLLYYELGYDTDGQGELPLTWESCIGRTNAFSSIKSNVGVIDIDKSLVLVDTVSLQDALTVREFCKYLQNSEYINVEEFDIDDYVGSDYI